MLSSHLILTLYTAFVSCQPLDIETEQSENECVYCAYLNGNCKVNTTGYMVFRMSIKDQIKIISKNTENSNFTEGSEFGDASWKCMIPGTVIIEVLETFICFWAPTKGCNAVAKKVPVNQRFMYYATCKICSKYCKCPVLRRASATRLEIDTISLAISLMVHLLFQYRRIQCKICQLNS